MRTCAEPMEPFPFCLKALGSGMKMIVFLYVLFKQVTSKKRLPMMVTVAVMTMMRTTSMVT